MDDNNTHALGGKSIGYCNVTCACSQYWRLEFKEVHITKLLWSILSYLQTLLMHSTLITVYGYMYWLLSKCSFLHLVNMLEFKYTKLLLSILSYLLQTLLMYPYNALGVHVLVIVKMQLSAFSQHVGIQIYYKTPVIYLILSFTNIAHVSL